MLKYPPLSIHHLSPNHEGKDYLVGDIHGAFETLKRQLQAIGFREDCDRLICTGDLLDRGPHSAQALEWLQKPWFHSVRGNHEYMFLHWRELHNHRVLQKGYEDTIYFKYGGEWVQQCSEEILEQLEQHILRLPYLIAISTLEQEMVLVTHAGVPNRTRWADLYHLPLDPAMIEELLWSRERMKEAIQMKKEEMYAQDQHQISIQHDHPFSLFEQQKVKSKNQSQRLYTDNHIVQGVNTVVCGHHLVTHPYRYGNFLCIETGGWKPYGHFTILPLHQVIR